MEYTMAVIFITHLNFLHIRKNENKNKQTNLLAHNKPPGLNYLCPVPTG